MGVGGLSRLYVPTEDQEQRTVCEWLDLHGITYIHVPNGGKRARVEAAIFSGLGVKKGFPDLLIFDRPARVAFHGAAIELKRRGREKERNGGLSVEQLEWLDRLFRLGWATKVAYGANQAIHWLESLGYGRRAG